MLRSRRHSHAALLLVAMWIVTPIVSVFHVAFEDHVYCAEHDTLEDAADPADSERLASRSGFETRWRASDRDDPSGHHDGCAFDDCATRDAAELDVADVGVAAPGFRLPARARVTTVATASIPLLRFAPKSSPPLAS